MKVNNTPNNHIPETGLRAANAVCRDMGISDSTLWRYRDRGWLKTVNINGKVYVDIVSLAEFGRRAAQGEFSKQAKGAAARGGYPPSATQMSS